MSPQPGNSYFPTTRWTRVLHMLAKDDEVVRREALAQLCQDYWYPLYAFARRQGRSQEDAEDLAQGFFIHALEHEVFSLADRNLGTLRTFLLKIFQRYASDVRDRERAQKRGGGREHLPLTFEDGEELYSRNLSSDETPELLYDRAWAQSLLRMTLASLEEGERSAGRGDQFEALRSFLSPDSVADRDYEAAGKACGLSAEAARQAVSRLRKKFRGCLREQIAATLHEPDDARIDEELGALKVALRG